MTKIMNDPNSDSLLVPDDMTQERLVSNGPIIVRRRVRWGECDPAQVVYTPRFTDYLAAAFGWFLRVVMADVLVADDGSRLSTPMKALSLEFHRVLRPDDLFDMTVHVLDVRQRTFDLHIFARSLDNEARFEGRLSPIIVDKNFRSVDMPARLRDALLAYQAAWPVDMQETQ